MNPNPQAPFPPGYEYQEYPKDVHRFVKNEKDELVREAKTVQDPDDEKVNAPVAEGWHQSISEAKKIAERGSKKGAAGRPASSTD